ncbi:GspE/PulE family protein [Chitinibacter sp. S2-10]|uniref:GspE/PulE family protein n=1 Tax=Chitinibacter sp. S2-10 TaxID=3373597 RepID=UPI003977E141
MNAPVQITRLRIGELLLGKGLISSDQLEIALREQAKTPVLLGQLLVSLGFLSESLLREALVENLGHGSIDLSRAIADPRALALLDKTVAKRWLVLPIALDQRRLSIAMAQPNNLLLLDQLRLQTRDEYTIIPLLAAESDIIAGIDRYYGFELSIDGILREIETGELHESIQTGADYSQPVVRLIDAILADAVTRGASDVHFEPEQAFVRIRYRIDGILRQIRALHKSYWPAMVVRLKVLAGLNIAENRAPQDGRISLTLCARNLDFRVASLPTNWGENIVLRILDRNKNLLALDELGLSQTQLATLHRMLARPEGLILLTGPTGSGKTTTLYSILSHLNSVERNIMTLEDPVEYPLAMIRQTSIGDVVKMDFANGIRALLRQDPDVILIGEIRDHDTAEMAMRAAMTGHQVYATLHTASALGAIARLFDLGVQPDVLAGNLIGMVAQRLVRLLCPACKVAYQSDEIECRQLGIDAPTTIYRAAACPECEQQGYRGRTTVMELLRVDSRLEELIARRATLGEMQQATRDFASLSDDACRRVLAGETSLAEIGRVVDLTGRA